MFQRTSPPNNVAQRKDLKPKGNDVTHKRTSSSLLDSEMSEQTVNIKSVTAGKTGGNIIVKKQQQA